jgi:osmotically-inducible protein OsmY
VVFLNARKLENSIQEMVEILHPRVTSMRRLFLSNLNRLWLAGSVASLLVILIGGIVFHAFADQPAKQENLINDLDWDLEVRVRQTLRDVKDFAPYRLGVTIQNGIAKVWGNVPSQELSESIVKTVRKVKGIQEVRNELKVVGQPDDLPDRIAKAVATHTPVQQTPVPQRQTEAIVRAPSKAPVLTTSQSSTTMKQPETNMVMKPSLQKEVDFHQWMEAIRKSDLRYREIRWSFENGIVRLEGFVERKSDVWDLADRIADLSGVRRVLVDRVKSR